MTGGISGLAGVGMAIKEGTGELIPGSFKRVGDFIERAGPV